MIVLSSPGPRVTAAENAIKSHFPALEHCWIIAGPNSPGANPSAYENASRLKKRYEELKNNREFHIYIEQVDDEHNPEKIFHLVESIYHQARAKGISDREIIADYTGGTKSMTAGMVLSCIAGADRDAEYMKSTTLTESGTAGATSDAQPIAVKLSL